MYSKESCNNLANIIHGHRRFRLKRPLNDLHSAATGGSRPGRAEERRAGVSLMVTSPGADTMSQYQGLTPESGSGMSHGPLHCHKITRQQSHKQHAASDTLYSVCILYSGY